MRILQFWGAHKAFCVFSLLALLVVGVDRKSVV